MAMYLGNQAVKILAPSINLFDKSLIDTGGWDFPNCSELEVSADNNTIIVKGNITDGISEYQYAWGWVRPTYVAIARGAKGISLKKGDVITISADFTLIEQGTKSAGVRCYLCDFKNSSNDLTLVNQQSISATKQRLTWKFTAIGDGDGYFPCFPINQNKVKIENISVNKVKDYWRIRSGLNMGRNPKNLIPFPYADTSVQNGGTKFGVTYNIADDGIITLNGTSTAVNYFALTYNLPLVEGKNYTISGSYGSNSNSAWRVYIECYTADNGKLEGAICRDGAITFTAPTGCAYGNLYLYAGSGITFNNQVFKPVISKGTKALPYYYYD